MLKWLKPFAIVGLASTLCAANVPEPFVDIGVSIGAVKRDRVTILRKDPAKPPFMVVRGRFPGERPRVRVNSDLFAVSYLLKHIDDQRGRLLDEATQGRRAGFFGWATLWEMLADHDLAPTILKAWRLERETYRAIYVAARILNPVEQRREASQVTRRAYCAAEALPIRGLDTLPWWRDEVEKRRESLREDGWRLRTLRDGRLRTPLAHATFATNDASLTEEGRMELHGVAARLAANPEIAVVLEGHTDARDAYAPWKDNHDLGLARAKAAAAALEAAGVPAERIQVVSKAESEPPDDGGSPRRVEAIVKVCQPNGR